MFHVKHQTQHIIDKYNYKIYKMRHSIIEREYVSLKNDIIIDVIYNL